MARFSIRNLFKRTPVTAAAQPDKRKDIVVAVDDSLDERNLTAFDNSVITFSSDMSSTDYKALLRNKQANITTFYQLADYFTDADPIVHGIIKGVYVPFTQGKWYLTCDNEKTIDIFEEHYAKIRLREKIDDIFLQYYKYANVYAYIWKGNILTLPPHKCRIGNTTLNGTPIVEFNVRDIAMEFKQRTYSVLRQPGTHDDTIEEILKAYPPEIAEALRKGKDYAELDPKNCFVLQGSKEGWQRYAIPWIAQALSALARKEMINKYEASELNIGARSFIHIRYGDDKMDYDMLPDAQQLMAIRNVFSKAMSGSPLAVTNYLAKAEVVTKDMSSLYQWPLYDGVNSEILSAGGIAGIIVNGDSQEGSTFASAQISSQSVTTRIENARKEFEDFMLKVNNRLVEDIKLIHTNNLKTIPEFHFIPFDMNGEKALRETCKDLWSEGIVSTRTMLNNFGYSLSKEKAQREAEGEDGTDEVFIPRDAMTHEADPADDDPKPVGRPKQDNDERHSDPENAIRSKQAKDAADGDVTEDTT